jgi:hypothetical protein
VCKAAHAVLAREQAQTTGSLLAVIRQALEECKYLGADHGMSVREFAHNGEIKMVKYRFWWFVRDYGSRNKTRDEVFTRISASLGSEDLKGTEVILAQRLPAGPGRAVGDN